MSCFNVESIDSHAITLHRSPLALDTMLLIYPKPTQITNMQQLEQVPWNVRGMT
jgi:hypothetical protein